MKKTFIALFFQVIVLFSGITFLSGQTTKYTISGYIYEKGSRETLVGANVYEPNLRIGSSSNTYGFYSRWNVRPQKTSEPNYFRTGGIVRSYQINDYGNNDTVFIGSQELWLERGNEFFSDEEGALYNFKGEYYGWIDFDGSQGQGETSQRIDSVFVFVLQTDFAYYRFHQSVDDYFYYGEDFPFAESVHIYSNIEGGLGAFGGYNRKDYMIRAFDPAK